jgi:hypothetical protein
VFFFHPDFTVGPGIIPGLQNARGLVGKSRITTGGEFHPAPKTAYIIYLECNSRKGILSSVAVPISVTVQSYCPENNHRSATECNKNAQDKPSDAETF